MNTVRLALAALRRDWRAGELRLVALALVIAVGAVTAVGFFTDRVQQAMERQAGTLLAADLIVASDDPLPPAVPDEARALGLRTAHIITFRSVIAEGEKLQLTEVKALQAPYPLRGRLQIAPAPFAPGHDTSKVPAPGTVWLDARLSEVLGIPVGGEVHLGAANFRVAAILTFEPDRGGDLFNIAPRLMMNIADVPKTKLLLPGSRASYRLLLAGPPESLSQFRRWAGSRLPSGAELRGIRDARPALRTALQRAEQFLGLAALVSVLLAGVAIATSARRFAARHLDACAVMRCLGATQRRIGAIYALEMLGLGLLAGLAGCALGYAAQWGLAAIMPALVNGSLPAPSLWPLLRGLLTGLAALLGFALPPLLRLKDVPPARVLRRDLGPAPRSNAGLYLAALAAICALAPWEAGQARVTVYVLGGSALTLAMLALASTALVRALGSMRARVGVAWRYGLANVARRGRGSMVQTVALGLGLMVMLLLTLVRADLLSGWEASLPPKAPNHFIINIQPSQVQAMRSAFRRDGLAPPSFYPMVRGRLTAINGHPVKPENYSDQRARRLADRDFNLSWAREPQSANGIAAGRWWTAAPAPAHQWSVESGIAKTLGIRLGDTLSFHVADRTIQGKVTSLRRVNWDSFNVNFFVLTPPGMLESYPATWITAFYLDPQRQQVLADLVREFPSITIIDVAALMRQVRLIMHRVTLAVQYVFLFTVLAGLLVLYAAIQATHDERMHESAVLRTLGASHRKVLQGLAAEFVTLGLVAGAVASFAATVLGYLLATRVLHIDYTFDPLLWLGGLLAGAIGVGLAGVLGTRSVLKHPPLATLRRV